MTWGGRLAGWEGGRTGPGGGPGGQGGVGGGWPGMGCLVGTVVQPKRVYVCAE